MTVMKLPEKFRNRKPEVIILPAEEQEKSSKKAADIMLKREPFYKLSLKILGLTKKHDGNRVLIGSLN